jgi:hypothetical protein
MSTIDTNSSIWVLSVVPRVLLPTTPYLFNIQRELGQQTVLEVGYLGSEGHRLERFRAINEALPGPGSTKSRQP